jgi:hypothetical protein
MKSKSGMKSLGVLTSVMVRTDALLLNSEGAIDKADKAAGDHQRPQGEEVEVAIPSLAITETYAYGDPFGNLLCWSHDRK